MDFIQFIWLSIPALYYLISLWGWLEKKGRSVKKQNPGDFLKQGTFILLSVGIAFVLDIYLLEDLVALLPDLMPLLFYRILLLPVVLFLVASATGGSTPHSLKKKDARKSKR